MIKILCIFQCCLLVWTSQHEDLENRIGDIERKYDVQILALSVKNNELQDTCKRTEGRLTELNEHAKRLEEENQNMKREIRSLKNYFTNNINNLTISDLRKRLLVGVQAPTTQDPTQEIVAFYARLNKKYDSLGVHETVIYDTVLTNVGNGYDVNIGIFICPVSGVYLFAATVASDDDHGASRNLDAEIVHNGNSVARLHATVYGYDMGSQVAIIVCQQGDKVWIRHMDGAGDTRVMPASYSGFAGTLLHRI